MQFSLIIPLWNESHNIYSLVESIATSNLHVNGMLELILVNNGSADETGKLIDEAANKYVWIKTVHLAKNLNYGGGVYEGCRYANADIFCYIPGDLQVLPDDVEKVFRVFSASANKESLLVKGDRKLRFDSWQNQFVSNVYTKLSNIILGLMVRDVNGLPKMFHRNLLNLLPEERMKTFVFDSQLILVARMNEWEILEVDVTFHARREGVSSWSKKRLQVYFEVLKQILRLRKLRNDPGIELKRVE